MKHNAYIWQIHLTKVHFPNKSACFLNNIQDLRSQDHNLSKLWWHEQIGQEESETIRNFEQSMVVVKFPSTDIDCLVLISMQ